MPRISSPAVPENVLLPDNCNRIDLVQVLLDENGNPKAGEFTSFEAIRIPNGGYLTKWEFSFKDCLELFFTRNLYVWCWPGEDQMPQPVHLVLHPGDDISLRQDQDNNVTLNKDNGTS